ncbi:MAG: hypothetical protein ACI9K5_004066, partial [Gammaproteobacteria bacterium]
MVIEPGVRGGVFATRTAGAVRAAAKLGEASADEALAGWDWRTAVGWGDGPHDPVGKSGSRLGESDHPGLPDPDLTAKSNPGGSVGRSPPPSTAPSFSWWRNPIRIKSGVRGRPSTTPRTV